MTINFENTVEDFYNEVESITKTVRRKVSPYIHSNTSENTIWLHDTGSFGGSFHDYAIYLSTLTLLYDKIYWYNPCNNLIIPQSFNNSDFRHKLAKYGVTAAFPDLLAELVRSNIVIPVGSHFNYSCPTESSQESVICDHLLEVPYLPLTDLEGYSIFENVVIDPFIRNHYNKFPDISKSTVSYEILEAMILNKSFRSTTLFSPNEYSNLVWNAVFGITNEISPNFSKVDQNEFESVKLYNRFFERVVLKSPQLMDPIELQQIRSKLNAKKMREWLNTSYEKASAQMPHTNQMDPIVEEFNYLANIYGVKKGRIIIDFTISAIMGGLGAIVAGIPGAIIGAGGTVLVKPPLMQCIGKHFTNYSWVVTITELREKYRIG